MKELLNKRVSIVVRGFPKLMTGKLLQADKDCLHLLTQVPDGPEKTKDAIVRIPKGSVGLFYPVEEQIQDTTKIKETAKIATQDPADIRPLGYVPCYILCCIDKERGCPGVKYIKTGKSPTSDDFKVFMKECPKLASTCKKFNVGELRDAPGKVVASLLDGVMLGDYPEK